MMRSSHLLPLCVSALLALVAVARADSDAPVAGPGDTFGPYRALTLDRSILRDVKVDKEGNVFLQLFPKHKDKEIVVKISDQKFAGYREWWHGGYELVSPANSGKPPYGWTDWLQTTGDYIEYWMEGNIFLHLVRKDAS